MTASTVCPCGVAVTGFVEASGRPEQAVVVYEQAAFQALALGAQLFARCLDDGRSPAEAAELNLIARRSRIVHAQLEQQLTPSAPCARSAPILAGQLRAHALEYGRIAARLYREAARLDAAVLPDGLAGNGGGPSDGAQNGS